MAELILIILATYLIATGERDVLFWFSGGIFITACINSLVNRLVEKREPEIIPARMDCSHDIPDSITNQE